MASKPMLPHDGHHGLDEVHHLLLQSVFAISMFLGCLISYLMPVHVLRWIRPKTSHVNMNIQEVEQEEMDRKRWMEGVIGYCNCVGAGVFVAVCFLGVIPVVQQEFEGFFSLMGWTDVHYPVAELTTLLGFFLVLFLEHAVLSYNKGPPDNGHHHHPLKREEEEEDEDDLRLGLLSHEEHQFHQIPIHPNHQPDSLPAVIPDPKHHGHDHGHSHSNEGGGGHGHSHSFDFDASGFTFFVLMFATSIHSIFEGLALGLMKDTVRSIHIFIGIIIHECIVAVALGLNSAKVHHHPDDVVASPVVTKTGDIEGVVEEEAVQVPKPSSSMGTSLKFGLLFSGTIPIGILMGVGIGYTPGSVGKLVSAVMQALAAGTFLHVAFCELIPAELGHHSHSHSQSDDHHHQDDASSSRGSASSPATDDDVHLYGPKVEVVTSSSSSSIKHRNKKRCFINLFSWMIIQDDRLFRITLIFAGFMAMAFITLFIDH